MPAQTTAEPAVISQNVELRSATSSSSSADLYALAFRGILRQEWIAANPESVPEAMNPFAAVAHEHRVTNRPSIANEDDCEIKPLVATTTTERYHGPRGRLLAFKQAR
jgi:hypothetical protein